LGIRETWELCWDYELREEDEMKLISKDAAFLPQSDENGFKT